MFEWNKEDDRQFKALTGLTYRAFCALIPFFVEAYAQAVWTNYEQQKDTRKRKPGGGQKGRLNTAGKKLYFILYYLKVYPTFDVLGDHFQLDRSKACTNVHKLLPILIAALAKAGVLPKRQFATVEELQAAWADIEDLLVDATERPHHRPQDEQEQKEMYSGKKKRHTVKNTTISNIGQQILFLGYTVFGHCHDYTLFKSEFSPELAWFKTFRLWVDLGYLGIRNDYAGSEIYIPHKKKPKSKSNPLPTLTEEQRAENRKVSQVRILVENAICRMKRFKSVVDVFRNRKDNFVDDVALAAAALANWSLSFASTAT